MRIECLNMKCINETIFSIILIISLIFTSSVQLTHLDASDLTRIKEAIALPQTLTGVSLSTLYYTLQAQTLLPQFSGFKDSAALCKHLQNSVANDDQLESVFYASSAAKLLQNCQISPVKFVTKLESNIKDDSSVQDLYRSVISLINLGRTIDSTKVSKSLGAALKKDETLLNTGLAFQLAAKLTKPEDRNPFIEKIGDVIVQADEVDGKYLQFEGGLGITANIILGIYRLATVSGKPIGLKNDQSLKFANYFLSRKYVLSPKGIAELLEVLKFFTDNKYHIPVIITNYGSIAISAKNAVLSVRITNVLGTSLGQLTVVADSATRTEDKKVIWSKKSLTQVQGDSTLYALNFFETKPPRGFYDIVITATPSKADPRLIGISGTTVKAIVLTDVTIVNADISVADRDSSGTGAVTKLEYPNSLTAPIDADYQQRLLMKFQIKDKIAGDVLLAHQTFVQFTNINTKQEIVFIAESDSTQTYKLDINLQAKAKDFNYISGVYRLTLIIGDAVISNPIEWKVATVNLQLPSNPSPSEERQSPYVPKKEIKHLFREQEKRPPVVVSNAFSALALVPLLILIGLWIKIGVNVSAFPLSLSAIVFHIGLAMIFLLYGCCFVHLNMFQTCKYLAGIGLITFLAGHSLLSRIANRK